MATIRQAVDIMGEFYTRERANEDWKNWFIANDIAIPLSYLCFHGFANPTDMSKAPIDETWQSFCEIFRIDHHAEFDSLDDFLDFAYNQPDSS